MDKWLLRSSSNPQQNKQKNQQPRSQQELKEEQDLKLALEQSRMESEVEKAMALSLCEQYEREKLWNATKQPIISTRRPRSTISETQLEPSSGTWTVDSFVNDLLHQPPVKTNEYADDDDDDEYTSKNQVRQHQHQSTDDDEYTSKNQGRQQQHQSTDDDATKDDDEYTSKNQVRQHQHQSTDDDATEDEHTTEVEYVTTDDDDDDTKNPTTTTNDDDWEIVDSSSSETESTSPNRNQHWHDEQAENQFFGQFNRSTWDHVEIRSNSDARKKRSISTVIKKNKKQKSKSSHTSMTSGHNYYATNDDVLDESLDAAGFGDSAAGLSWETMGQSRYA